MEEEITDYQEKYNAAVRVNEIDGSTDVLKVCLLTSWHHMLYNLLNNVFQNGLLA